MHEWFNQLLGACGRGRGRLGFEGRHNGVGRDRQGILWTCFAFAGSTELLLGDHLPGPAARLERDQPRGLTGMRLFLPGSSLGPCAAGKR